MFVRLDNKKKLLTKLKNCCTAISKYNLSSPVLLQFVMYNNDLEFILSHSTINDKIDIRQILSVVTFDEFYISEEEEKLFNLDDNILTSVPIVVSSMDIDEATMSIANVNMENYKLCNQSYYIFPKFVLECLKREIIEEFEVNYLLDKKFDLNICYRPEEDVRHRLFLNNTNYLNSIFQSCILPFNFPKHITQPREVLTNIQNPDIETYLYMDNKDEINEFVNADKMSDFIRYTDVKGCSMSIFQNVFLRINLTITEMFISKRYEEENRTVISIYCKLKINNGTYIYFKYKYFDV